jgi:hypothetical protein
LRVCSQGYASYYRFKTIMGVCYTLNFLIELLVGAWYDFLSCFHP